MRKVAFFVLSVCSVLTTAASLMTLCLKAETGHQATQKKQLSDLRKCHETKLSKQREFRIYLLDQSFLEIVFADHF